MTYHPGGWWFGWGDPGGPGWELLVGVAPALAAGAFRWGIFLAGTLSPGFSPGSTRDGGSAVPGGPPEEPTWKKVLKWTAGAVAVAAVAVAGWYYLGTPPGSPPPSPPGTPPMSPPADDFVLPPDLGKEFVEWIRRPPPPPTAVGGLPGGGPTGVSLGVALAGGVLFSVVAVCLVPAVVAAGPTVVAVGWTLLPAAVNMAFVAVGSQLVDLTGPEAPPFTPVPAVIAAAPYVAAAAAAAGGPEFHVVVAAAGAVAVAALVGSPVFALWVGAYLVWTLGGHPPGPAAVADWVATLSPEWDQHFRTAAAHLVPSLRDSLDRGDPAAAVADARGYLTEVVRVGARYGDNYPAAVAAAQAALTGALTVDAAHPEVVRLCGTIVEGTATAVGGGAHYLFVGVADAGAEPALFDRTFVLAVHSVSYDETFKAVERLPSELVNPARHAMHQHYPRMIDDFRSFP